MLEAQFRLLRPNARNGVSSFFLLVVLSSWPSPLTRGPPILFSLLCLTCSPTSLTRPRPQFPPILFSKQVCKTQFSYKLTSHLIARWSMPSLFLSPLLRSIHFLFFSHLLLFLSQSSACHFFRVLTIPPLHYVHTNDHNRATDDLTKSFWTFLKSIENFLDICNKYLCM